MVKKRLWKRLLSLCILLFVFSSIQIVKADDDEEWHEEQRYERYKKFERDDEWKEKEDKWKNRHDAWEDDDWDDDWKGEEKPSFPRDNQPSPSFWNVWTRDTNLSLSDNLPIQEAKEVPVAWNGKSKSLYIVPFNGQLLVSGKKMAQILGLEATFYKQSRILEVSNDEDELIVRAGTNAAYENMVKTPMPVKALYYEKSLYLPISVLANAFGYRVSWEETTGTITLINMNK